MQSSANGTAIEQIVFSSYKADDRERDDAHVVYANPKAIHCRKVAREYMESCRKTESGRSASENDPGGEVVLPGHLYRFRAEADSRPGVQQGNRKEVYVDVARLVVDIS